MSFRRMFQHKKGVLPSLVAALLVPAMAHAFDPFVVRDIRVEGSSEPTPAPYSVISP